MRELDAAFERIEIAVLPAVASMLDALIDAAAGARPGIDAERYASELRALAEQARSAATALDELMLGDILPHEYYAPQGHADAA